jgi:MFS family permease
VSRFGQLITHGTFYTAGVQLSNVAVVLPFICAQRGSLWAAGLLYPAFSVGTIAGSFMSPFILNWSRDLRHLVVAAASAAMATLVACNAVVARNGVLLAAMFLVTSAAIGAVAGVTTVAFRDLVVAKLPDVRRGDVFLRQGAAGSTLAAIVTLLIVPVLAHGDPASRQVNLLWLGATGLAVAAVAAVFVGPVSKRYATKRRSMRHTLKEGLVAARSQPWFRRYVLTQFLFVPIGLGATFYSLRAAQPGGDLHMLVIISSLGLVAGSLLWQGVYRTYGVRGMLIGSVLLSSSAAVICITSETHQRWSNGWTHGVVFLLATVASQAVFAAAISWIGVAANEDDRAMLISFGSIVVAVSSSAAGAVLGGIASNHSTIWPVVIVLVLSLVAADAALRAPAPDRLGKREPPLKSPQRF